MRRIKRKAGGEVIIISDGEACPGGSICFSEEEYAWAQKIASSSSYDPEQLKAFWEHCFEKKLAIPGYTLFSEFPKEKDPPAPSIAQKYCTEILEMLKGRRQTKVDATDQGS